MKYTIIGLYENGQVFSDVYDEEEIYAAMFAVARCYPHESLQILGAIPGEHTITPACESDGSAAFAADMAEHGAA